MLKKYREIGSVHIVTAVVLLVIVLGGLGFVFYQKYIAKSTSSEGASSTAQTKSETQKSNQTETLTAYCMPIEKLCFDYPKNWKLEGGSAEFMASPPFMRDVITLKNTKGDDMLMATTGIDGIGGMCSPDVDGKVSVVATYSTKLTGYAANEYTNDTVYAVKLITQASTNKYVAGITLTRSPLLTDIRDTTICQLSYHGLIPGKNVNTGGGAHGSFVFSNSSLAHTAEGASFTTYQDAADYLKSDDVETAYRVLRSVHY